MTISGLPKPIKRSIAKNGTAYYYQGRQRLTTKDGAKKWVEQSFAEIDVNSLTPSELRSFRAKESGLKNRDLFRQKISARFRFFGRIIPQYLQNVLKETVLNLVGDSQKELTKVFPEVKDYGQLLKKAQSLLSTVVLPPTEWGLPNVKRNRVEVESVIDIARRIDDDETLRLLDLQVITKTGQLVVGRIAALTAVRDYEMNEIDEIMKGGGNPAYVRFRHFGEIDVEKKTFTIDLNETDVDPMYSP